MSILFLTVHKCASTFMTEQVLPATAEDQGLRFVNPFMSVWWAGEDVAAVPVEPYAAQTDCLLGPVHLPEPIERPELFDDWTKVLFLRDPRDVLVSLYFHKLRMSAREDGSLAYRDVKSERARRRGIDRQTLHSAKGIRKRYKDYRRRWSKQPNLTLLRYEDMVGDWPGFVDAFSAALPRPASAAWRDRMLAQADAFAPGEERPGSHRRQVLAGDHIRKLKPETIAELDRMFSAELDWLGYDHQ